MLYSVLRLIGALLDVSIQSTEAARRARTHVITFVPSIVLCFIGESM